MNVLLLQQLAWVVAPHLHGSLVIKAVLYFLFPDGFPTLSFTIQSR